MGEIKYFVIGGQYESICYGGAPTLAAAKQLANKNREYWDNWEGWHTPKIYCADDTEVIESQGRILTPNGQDARIPRAGATPIKTIKKDALYGR